MNKIATADFAASLPAGLRLPIRVNFVVSQDLQSKIFYDIFRRYVAFDPALLAVEISAEPVPDADIYHYHRPHLETDLARPAVVTVHHDPRDVDPWLHPEKFWAVYRQADRIVCLNSLQVEDLAQAGLTHTTVVPHGYDRIIFQKRLKTFDPARKRVLGIVSKRYDRRFKGDAYVYEMLDRLSPEDVRLILVGAGRSADAARMRDRGFEVDVFDYLPYRLFGDLYRRMDFLVMVSTYEGGPANLPEALASSVPVLCTRVGMVPDMIRDGENGLILSGDIRADMPRLAAVIANEGGLADRLFQGAHDSDTVITWEDVIALHIRHYADILMAQGA